MKSKIVLFFTIILSFLLQSTLLQKIAIGSITPNLLLILCVSMGLMRGRKRTACRPVLWICIWILCADLYVCGIFQWLCIPYLL